MIIEVKENTLASIRNPALRSYAETYVKIYADFMAQIRQFGVEIEPCDQSENYGPRLAALRKKGAMVRNDSKSVYVNHISPACQACRTGKGSATFFISLKCHRDCFYCFNPNQENYAYFREHTRDTVAELEAIRRSGHRVRHLALTGGEPLLHKEETIRFCQIARQNFPKAYTRLYTCGDHLDREIMQSLKEAQLDEVRFSIRMHDSPKGRGHTYDRIALARAYIPNVMVEMPVLPGTLEEMKAILTELDRLGVFGINLLEFCFPLHNGDVFREKGYRIKARPYRVLYDYWYAGGLPIAGSEAVCLDLIEFALQSGLELGVHYCSLENKHSGQIYQQNKNHALSKTMYFSQKDYFLKTAKVFGDDAPRVLDFFKHKKYDNYRYDNDHGYLEFHVSKIKSLTRFDMQVGISTNVLENRGGEVYLRELKVDVTTPRAFKLSDL
ncbi:MAG: radical SAM protein [Anaerolineales bacterium]|jgi:pyruvate formate-lyase activating enzyme-like uncharacterized protein